MTEMFISLLERRSKRVHFSTQKMGQVDTVKKHWNLNPTQTKTGLQFKATKTDTLRKINMEPENIPLEKENNLPNHHFQVTC